MPARGADVGDLSGIAARAGGALSTSPLFKSLPPPASYRSSAQTQLWERVESVSSAGVLSNTLNRALLLPAAACVTRSSHFVPLRDKA